MFRAKTQLSALFLGAVLISPLSAALVYYDIPTTGPNPSDNAQVTTKDPLVTATSIKSATTGNGPGNFSVSGSSGTAYLQYSQSADSLAGAISDQDYLEFSITVGAMNTLNLTSLGLTNHAESGAESNLSLFLSLDGFASEPDAVDVIGTVTTTDGTPTARTISIAGYSGLSDATVTFRLYGWDNDGTEGKYNRVSDLTINGSVPEPSSALISLLAIPLMWGRRRKR